MQNIPHLFFIFLLLYSTDALSQTLGDIQKRCRSQIRTVHSFNTFDTHPKNQDFSDCSPDTLCSKAAEALKKSDWNTVDEYTKKCIQSYQDQARSQQGTLSNYPDIITARNYTYLNDVAYCHYLRGEMFIALKQTKKAIAEYRIPINEYGFAIGYDPDDNIYWRIAGKCKSIIIQLQSKIYN
jgi:hypothetical protein